MKEFYYADGNKAMDGDIVRIGGLSGYEDEICLDNLPQSIQWDGVIMENVELIAREGE